MFFTGASYCDFVIWVDDRLHIERIFPDPVFWTEKYGSFTFSLKLFFYEVLPEIWLSFSY